MNAAQYITEILGPFLVPYWQRLKETRTDLLLIEDGAGPHKAVVTQKYHESVSLLRMIWPGNSPDLNPIENAWRSLKAKLQKRFRDPLKRAHSEDELWEAIQEEWEGLSMEMLNKWIDSMVERVQTVVSKNGGHTKW